MLVSSAQCSTYWFSRTKKNYHVKIITQNIDDLHERAGSTDVLHLHGEIVQMRSVLNDEILYACREDIHVGDLAADGGQLRPHVVWFGEAVPNMEKAIHLVGEADIFVLIGTSLLVYPAASLVDIIKDSIPKYILDRSIPPLAHNE